MSGVLLLAIIHMWDWLNKKFKPEHTVHDKINLSI